MDAAVKDLLMGRLCEAIVEAIFYESGVPIQRTGFEWLRPLLPHVDEAVDARINKRLGGMPDFYFSRSENGRTTSQYIEVKFRANGKLEPDEIKSLRENPWQPTVILFRLLDAASETVRSPIQVIRPPYKERPGGFQYSEPLTAQTAWGIKTELCDKYEELTSVYHAYNVFL